MRLRLIDVEQVKLNPGLELRFKPSHGRAYSSADPSPPGMEFEEMRLSVVLDHVQCGTCCRKGSRTGHRVERRRCEGGHQDRRGSGRHHAGNRGGCAGAEADHGQRRGRRGSHRLGGGAPDVSARCWQEQRATDKKAGEQGFPEQLLAILPTSALAILPRRVSAGPGSTFPCRAAERSWSYPCGSE